jgi:hypothetical protein
VHIIRFFSGFCVNNIKKSFFSRYFLRRYILFGKTDGVKPLHKMMSISTHFTPHYSRRKTLLNVKNTLKPLKTSGVKPGQNRFGLDFVKNSGICRITANEKFTYIRKQQNNTLTA